MRGALVETPEGEVEIEARRGVVLACGGFPYDVARRRALFPHAPTGEEHWSAAPASNTGDGLRLGEAVGGQVDAGLSSPAAWAPVSLVPRRNGSFGHFPHLIERAKPGIIAVLANGRRFANEADGYHDFINAMFRAVQPGEEAACWLICDHRFLRRYGLGFAKPAPLPLMPYLRSGYLKRGKTIENLARACGIDPAGLARTSRNTIGTPARARTRNSAAARHRTTRLGGDPDAQAQSVRRAGRARGPSMRSRSCPAASAPSPG